LAAGPGQLGGFDVVGGGVGTRVAASQQAHDRLAGPAGRGRLALPEVPELEASAGQAVDLMSALEASVQKARVSRGEKSDAGVHELPAQKRTPAKKTACRRKDSKEDHREAET
jgi:hypothetical protein